MTDPVTITLHGRPWVVASHDATTLVLLPLRARYLGALQEGDRVEYDGAVWCVDLVADVRAYLVPAESP